MSATKPSNLSHYVEELASTGRHFFKRESAMEVLGINHGAFLDAAAKLGKRGYIVAPRRGFYVITPQRFLKWGAPPPSWYVDAMMRDAERPYYVGLLKAAELHGAAHQAVMDFQIVTDKQWKPIEVGRSRIVFHYRKNLSNVLSATDVRKTDTGSMVLASPALTALDLLRYCKASGGLDHAASVLNELAESIDIQQLLSLVPAFEIPVVQRLGYVLDFLTHDQLATPMQRAVKNRTVRWVELDPNEQLNMVDEVEPARDRRWHMIVRRSLEIDEQ